MLLKKDELFWVRLVAFFAFIIPMLISPSIWFSDRLFPLVSAFNEMSIPSFGIDVILISVFVLTFMFFVFKPTWKLGLIVVLIYLFWVILDQNRIQPFYFEIIFMVLALTQFGNNPRIAKQCVLLILVGTYFWSGIHKFNDVFFEKWSNGLAKRIPFVPLWMRMSFTYAVPFLEMSFGAFLIFTKTRKLGIYLITLMHIFIITTFIIGGYGYLVFPLTAFNVFTLFHLFHSKPFSPKALFKLNHPKSILFLLIAIVFPFLNFFGLYDHILAFSYFSGKPKYCRIHFNSSNDINSLPDHIKVNVRSFEGSSYIELNEWSARTIGVMVYPEKRVYVNIQRQINNLLDKPNTVLEYY